MSLQLWHLLCVILCVYNLLVLYGESKLVIFQRQEKVLNSTDHKFSVCLPLVELIEREVIRENETFTPQQLIDGVASSFLVGSEDSVILESSSVRHHHVCIDFLQEKFHRIFPNISTFQFRFFIHPANETLHYFYEACYRHSGLQLVNFTLYVFIRNIRFLPAPFETDCTDTWNFPKRQSYKKVRCLTECYKQHRNSTYFLYRYDERVQLKLNQKELVTIPECHEVCRPSDCIAKVFYRYLFFTTDEQTDNLPKIVLENVWIHAAPQLPAFSFAIQFISLWALFFNVSFYEILAILIKVLNRKLRRGPSKLLQSRLFLFIPKYFVLAFCICLLVSHFALSLVAYLRFEFIARQYYGSSKDFMPFTIFVCLPVQLAYLNVSQQLNVENEDLFLNKSLLEIRSDTSAAFNQIIEKSHLSKGDTRIPYRITEIGTEAIFKSEIFHSKMDEPKRLLARCFRVDLNVSEHKFENNLGFTQLLIELSHSDFTVHHAVFKHRLTSDSSQTHRNARLYLMKKSLLPSPYNSSCLNYGKFDGKLCTDRVNCVDQCYNEHFFGNHSSISTASVIYDQNFDGLVLSEARFNRSEDKEIRDYCESLYPNPDCQLTVFEEIFEQIEFFENKSLSKQIIVELYLYSTNQVEVGKLTMGMCLLLILNAECVLIGMNANKLLKIVIDSVRRGLAIRRHPKFFALLLFLLSLAGFITHSFLIFQQILTSELVRSESFDRLMKIDAANFMICFDTNLTQVDEYEKFTGSYFEKLTDNLTFESVFEKFEILDEQLKPMIVEPKDLKKHEKITIDLSFVYNLKCFNFELNITYKERDLFKFEDMFFVKIHFKSSLYEQECNCFKIYTAFFDKQKGGSEKLESYFLRRDQQSKVKNSFLIQPMVIEFDYTDRFYYLYKPLSLFNTASFINDDLLYFKNMVSNFRRITNCSTQLKSLRKSDRDLFELEINDDLLAQYHFQVQRELDESDFTNPNYNVNVLNLITLTSHQKAWPNVSDITIVPTAYTQKITITNESHWARLLINILNALNTWTSMSCFDLDVYLLKFFGIFQKIFQLLLRMEKRFKPNKFIF